MTTFVKRSRFDTTTEELFSWHRRPGAFERLSPPWERVEVLESIGGIEDGHVVLRMRAGPYGDRTDETLTETSTPGDDFLAGLCKQWEDEAGAARGCGVRVVNLRIGVVMTAAGGALAKMLPPFSMGVGGVLGDGRQHMPWIGLDDLVYAIHHALFVTSLGGPVLAVAPSAATNRELTRNLGRVLRRPTLLPMPAFAARAAFGEMADAALLASQRCRPLALPSSGFEYSHPHLEQLVRWTLGKPA